MAASTSNTKTTNKKLLIAFDFDHTIIDDNSDIVVKDLLDDNQIPKQVAAQRYQNDGWTLYMENIFKLLHKHNFTKEKMREALFEIEFTDGMQNLLDTLHKRGDCELIIISDSNTQFIKDWLEHVSYQHVIHKTFSNPAWYDSTGLLNIQMYHEQNWCDLSSKNLCKGHILKAYVADRQEQGTTFDYVAYVGDGGNDLCPSKILSSKDISFARQGYALAGGFNDQKPKYKIDAKIHIWGTGHDILDGLKLHIPDF